MTKRRTKKSRKRNFFKLCFPFYFVFCLFATIWLRAAVINMEYELGELDKTRTELVRERKMAVAQRANTYSAERIEKVALNSLGMVLPARDKVFYVQKTSEAVLYKASMKK